MSNIGNKETMAKNLAFYLEKSNRTQREMAEVVGVAASTFNDWMKAKKYPRIDKIEMMANYFGIKKSDLIEEKANTEEQKNNDRLAEVIVRMRTDESFFQLVSELNKLDEERLAGVAQMLQAFTK